MQGISPFDDRAGLAGWQTSSVPLIDVFPLCVSISGRDGEATIPRPIARRTMMACRLIAATIENSQKHVNVKL